MFYYIRGPPAGGRRLCRSNIATCFRNQMRGVAEVIRHNGECRASAWLNVTLDFHDQAWSSIREARHGVRARRDNLEGPPVKAQVAQSFVAH